MPGITFSRIGVLGGTFDPPHIGHLWLAETAQQQLGLEIVLFCPVGDPPHKRGRPISPLNNRIEMVQLAIAEDIGFQLDRTDSERPPPHTTCSLMPLLQARYPHSQLWLLIGSDGLRDLPTWYEPACILQHCRLGVLPRPGVQLNWKALLREVPALEGRVDLLAGPTVDISATEIRAWIGDGRSVRYLLPPKVSAYIAGRDLYTN